MNYRGPGIYRHYKGGEYEVLGLALQEDTVDKDVLGEGLSDGGGTVFVIYCPLTPGSLLEQRQEDFWARELSDFNAQVPDGSIPNVEASRPRFVYLGNAPEAYTTRQLSDAVRELERHMRNDQSCTPWALFNILERGGMALGVPNDEERAEIRRLKEAFKSGISVISNIPLSFWNCAKDEAISELREELAAASAAATDLAAAALRAARQIKPDPELAPGDTATIQLAEVIRALVELDRVAEKHKQFLPKQPPAWLDQGMDIDTPPSTPVGPEEEESGE